MADSGFGRFQSTCACETLVTKHCSKALKSSVNVQIGHGEWALSGLSSRFFLCLMCFAYPQRHRTLEEFTYAFSPAGHAPHYPHQFCRTVSSSNFRLCQNDTLGEADPADPLSTCSILPFWLSHLLLRSCKCFWQGILLTACLSSLPFLTGSPMRAGAICTSFSLCPRASRSHSLAHCRLSIIIELLWREYFKERVSFFGKTVWHQPVWYRWSFVTWKE